MTVQYRTNTISAPGGAPIANAYIVVRLPGSGDLAPIYSDSARAHLIPGSRVATGSDGVYAYYVAAGQYNEHITAPGYRPVDFAVVIDNLDMPVNVRDFGATGNGVTDDTDAIVDAWNHAMESGLKTLYFPLGVYVISSATESFDFASNMTLRGDGMGRTTIWWQDGVGAPYYLFGSPSLGSSRVSNITIQDLTIRGNHDSDFVSKNTYPIVIYRCDGLTLRNVEIAYSRMMSFVARASVDVTVQDCHIHHSARDGVNTYSCTGVEVINNTIEWCGDDAIAGDNDAVISNNKIRFAQGVKILGARGAAITGNNIDFFYRPGYYY